MLNYVYMFGGLIVVAACAHLIGLRAERHGRRYWVWFLLALPFGPLGTLFTFLLLEATLRSQSDKSPNSKSDIPPGDIGISQKR